MIRIYALGVTIAIVIGIAIGYLLHRPNPSVAVQVTHAATQHAEQAVAKIAPAFARRDTAVAKAIDHYHTIRDSIPYPVATPPDTVYDTTWVPRFIRACDQLALGCVAFRDTALAMHHADTTLISALREELKATQHDRPSLLHRLTTTALMVGVGFGAGYLYHAIK